jgi:ABC-2 type transport system permease protein
MNAQSLTMPVASVPTGRNTFRIYALEAKYEFIKALRMPAYSLPTLTFPVLFYLLFGIGMSTKSVGSMGMATYLIATYGAFGVIGAALFGFGVGIAIERGQGWMLQKRATPMPPMAYFTAKLAMSVIFGAIIVLELFAFGYLLGGVRMPLGTWLGLGAVLVAGAVPFAALGLALGYACGPNSAPAIVNMIHLPLAFASGLWIPIAFLPKFVQAIAHFLPAYHSSQLALAMIGASQGESVLVHGFALVAFTALGLALAWIGYRRDEDRTYG